VPLTAGERFLHALSLEKPLQIVGAINPLCALLAQEAGFRALYLSGAGVANASHALPDLGITHLEDVVEDSRRITSACDLPLLVDIDTGWGTRGNIVRTMRELDRVGVAAVHMEDQIAAKRCGHRPGKELVSTGEMCERIEAALSAQTGLILMARTDALAVEGMDSAIQRAKAYVAAGARMIFAEAIESLDGFRRFVGEVGVPILANSTEFGKTPLFKIEEYRSVGVSMVLYPLSAFRAMNFAAKNAYATIRRDGNQAALIDSMQTRAELYQLLRYYEAEQNSNPTRKSP